MSNSLISALGKGRIRVTAQNGTQSTLKPVASIFAIFGVPIPFLYSPF